MATCTEPADARCVFCGRDAILYIEVRGVSARDVDCTVCGQYRVSKDRENRILRKQFSRRVHADHLGAIRSSNADGHRYSIDDGRAILDGGEVG